MTKVKFFWFSLALAGVLYMSAEFFDVKYVGVVGNLILLGGILIILGISGNRVENPDISFPALVALIGGVVALVFGAFRLISIGDDSPVWFDFVLSLGCFVLWLGLVIFLFRSYQEPEQTEKVPAEHPEPEEGDK